MVGDSASGERTFLTLLAVIASRNVCGPILRLEGLISAKLNTGFVQKRRRLRILEKIQGVSCGERSGQVIERI